LISKTTPEFWQRYALLPERAQRLADKCYRFGNRIQSIDRFGSSGWKAIPHFILRVLEFITVRSHSKRAISSFGFGSVAIRSTTRSFASGVDW
jgi:hypothetical protein